MNKVGGSIHSLNWHKYIDKMNDSIGANTSGHKEKRNFDKFKIGFIEAIDTFKNGVKSNKDLSIEQRESHIYVLNWVSQMFEMLEDMFMKDIDLFIDDEDDDVESPSHYKIFDNLESVDIIRGLLTREEFGGWCWANMLKYSLRWKKKGGLKDLRKNKVYTEWLIDNYEGYDFKGSDKQILKEVIEVLKSHRMYKACEIVEDYFDFSEVDY